MKLYFVILLISLSIIITGNIFYVQNIGVSIGNMFLWLLIAILICGIASALITIFTRIIPSKFFSPLKKRYKVFPKENKLYLKLKIKKWKDKVPELGKLGGFAKNKIQEPNNSEYIYKFLTETCIAEFLHGYSIIAGLLVFLILPRIYFWTLSLPIFILNTILHVMPLLIQRYIRPKFLKIYNRLIQLESSDDEENEYSRV